jgi:hypothetical protein
MNYDNAMTEKRAAPNRRLAQWRVKCFYDSLVQGSSFVHSMKFSAENPLLRQAPKRYDKFLPSTLANVHCVV